MSQTLDATLDTLASGHAPCGRYPEAARATRWTVAVTHPQNEQWAAENLRRLGYSVYLPLHAVQRTVPRRYIAHLPLFRGYLFLALEVDQGWVAARYCSGVHKLCMTGNRPQFVRDGAVEALQAGEELRRCLPPPDATWPPGTPCRLANGSPLDGIDAVVIAVSGDDARVHVLMFGELREVVVKAACLMARDND